MLIAVRQFPDFRQAVSVSGNTDIKTLPSELTKEMINTLSCPKGSSFYF